MGFNIFYCSIYENIYATDFKQPEGKYNYAYDWYGWKLWEYFFDKYTGGGVKITSFLIN